MKGSKIFYVTVHSLSIYMPLVLVFEGQTIILKGVAHL